MTVHENPDGGSPLIANVLTEPVNEGLMPPGESNFGLGVVLPDGIVVNILAPG